MTQPRPLLALVALCAAIAAAGATAPGTNCELLYDNEPISQSNWLSRFPVGNYRIPKDTDSAGEILIGFTTKDISGFSYSGQSNYIDVEFDEAANTLSLVITEEFAHYEEDMISAQDPSEILVEIDFQCSDGNEAGLHFSITVEDVNTHAPEFEQSSYVYELPMPLPSGLNISCLVGAIFVTDIDFSNDAITIQFDEQGGELFTADVTYQGSRQYAVRLRSKTSIDLKETTSFTMTAVDSGSPTLSSGPATITINAYQGESPGTATRSAEPAFHKSISPKRGCTTSRC